MELKHFAGIVLTVQYGTILVFRIKVACVLTNRVIEILKWQNNLSLTAAFIFNGIAAALALIAICYLIGKLGERWSSLNLYFLKDLINNYKPRNKVNFSNNSSNSMQGFITFICLQHYWCNYYWIYSWGWVFSLSIC